MTHSAQTVNGPNTQEGLLTQAKGEALALALIKDLALVRALVAHSHLHIGGKAYYTLDARGLAS